MSEAPARPAAATRMFPTRRMDFSPALGSLPKHFAKDGDILMSHFFAMMSASFPTGEDFFVRSVRHFRKDITDPVLRKQVAAFIGQESMHGREHEVLNERLAELGYPVHLAPRMQASMDRLRARFPSPFRDLAQTAAAEHFTATMAELALSDPAVRASFGDPVFQSIGLWHSLEESEHKAVAFDVYRAMGGRERERIRVGKVMRWSMAFMPYLIVLVALRHDKALRRPGAFVKSWRRFRSSPLIGKQLTARLKEYERPGFHPHDRDTTALVEEWEQRLFGEDGSLNGVLVGSPAA